MPKCTTCEKEIHEKAVVCPGCGCPVETAATVGQPGPANTTSHAYVPQDPVAWLKKNIRIVIVVVIILFIVGLLTCDELSRKQKVRDHAREEKQRNENASQVACMACDSTSFGRYQGGIFIGSGRCNYCVGTGRIPMVDTRTGQPAGHSICQPCRGSGACPTCNGTGVIPNPRFSR